MRYLALLLSLVSGVALGQVSSAPVLLGQKGTTLPSVCHVGQLFFKTDATPGTNIYECTAANTWTQQYNSTAGSAAFNAITSGTNTTAAMVVGTGGSLGVTGSGTIAATSATNVAGGSSGQIPYQSGAGATAFDSGLAFSSITKGLGIIGPITTGQTGTGTGSLAFNGLTSGTVTVKPADAAGTWTLTLPTAGGTSGYVLSTDGTGVTSWVANGSGSMVYPGAGIPQSTGAAWGTSITPGTGVVTALGVNVGSAGAVVVNGGALGTPSSGTATNITGLPVGGISATGTPSSSTYLRGDGTWNTPAGSGTVNAGTAGQMAYYATSASAVSGNANATISNGALSLGVAGSVIGGLNLSGNTSGTVSINPQAAAGTYNFNLPTTAGTSGDFLRSGGGTTNAMTWLTPGTGVATAMANATNSTGGLATQNGAITAGNLLKGSATGVQDTGIAASALQPIIYSGQKALGTGAIASGACATVVTQAATGLATTSQVVLTYAATPVGVTGYDPSTTTGSLQVTGYPTANQINISVCNPTASSITPAAMTVNVVAY